jgi:hypothetical protein
MTAVGFVLSIVGFFIYEGAWTNSGKEKGAYVAAIGAGLLIIGVTTKLWETMP